jgi:HAD superfamily hydrolase (TIGR01509 family)
MTHPAAILDVDGTLVDSNDAHARAWVDAFAEAGMSVDYDRVRKAIGMGGDKLLPHVAGLSEDSTQGRQISERRSEIFKTRYLPDLRPFPGVRDLLERLSDDGFRIVVASSAQEDELDALLDIAGVSDLIESKTSSDSVDRSKPDPDIVQAALDRSRAPRELAIMIGDTPYDVEAARRTGIGIIAVECGGWTRGDLQGATRTYRSPSEIVASYDDSLFPQIASEAARRRAGQRAMVWWVAAPLMVIGTALVLGALYRQQRQRQREDLDRLKRARQRWMEPFDDGLVESDRRAPTRRAEGLSPRERRSLRRIISRTS